MKLRVIGQLLLLAALAPAAARAAEISYNRDIRPIFTETCFACHGPDSAARKADLRLDSFAAATAERKDSKPAIVPGKPDESEAIRRILTSDEDDIMPPMKSKKTLTSQQKDLLKRWVAEGAKYESHWSFVPATKPEVPKVEKKDWVKNPIDTFVLARLEKEGLIPAEEANRASIARRVSLDLTGLPPSAQMVEDFEKDQSANAYEKLVDSLLNSQQYGEHRARYWLDAARYADTHGIHFDNYREIWSYREWVINAFNQNMRFDQFTIEQLAGDLLPQPTLEQRIATGFNRCNMTTSEGGAIDEEYRVLYTRDRTETTSAVWMGLTANCAVCHDHKYDPLKQKEVYEMSAFFNNTTQPAMDGNKKDTPPVVVVPTRQDRPRWEELPEVKTVAKGRVDRRRQAAVEDFSEWLASAKSDQILEGIPTEGLTFSAPLKEATAPSVTVMVNGYPRTLPLGASPEGVIADNAFMTSKESVPSVAEAGDFERDQAFSAGLWIKLGEDKSGSVIARMDEDEAFRGWDVTIQDSKPGFHLISKWPEDALKVVSRKRLEANKWQHIFVTYDGSSKAAGVNVYIDGRIQDVDRDPDKLQNTTKSKAPFKIGQRKKGDQLEKAGVQDVRLYSRVLKVEEIAALRDKPRLSYLVSKPTDKRTEDEQKTVYDGYLNNYDSDYMAVAKAFAVLEEEERDIKKRGTIAHVMNEKETPPEAYVLFRGDYDKRRDKVGPATPEMLPKFPEEYPRNRLGFAKWLLRSEHPLTARVTVNRMWQELFGNGIVRTANDFGISGDQPSHQDLLDWLAVELRENGWDMKRMYKLMVMSATYRQAALTTPEKLAKDAENRLLSRGPRFRMDAEMIRDYALAASGLLSPKIGGPSVRPYQPDGVWEMVGMAESDTRNYKRDSGEKLYRRSLYSFWKRMAPPAAMDIFNAPSREVCTVRRERTNTPLQALATLNDPQFVEAARKLAERSFKECDGSDNDRLNWIARQLLARSFRDEERVVVHDTLSSLKEHYAAATRDAEELLKVGESKVEAKIEPVQLAAYTMVVNQLMNLDEVLNK
jgi:mono/diheme cytochrome c family protein